MRRGRKPRIILERKIRMLEIQIKDLEHRLLRAKEQIARMLEERKMKSFLGEEYWRYDWERRKYDA